MQNSTDEFSFVLKPAKFGVGVFATHDIKAETYLKLFGDFGVEVAVKRNKKDVPELFQHYCADRGNYLMCPRDFGCMEIGWYLNHSSNPSAYHKNYEYYAKRNIKANEEITIDYNTLEEPNENKPSYYRE